MAEHDWPSPHIKPLSLYLGDNRELAEQPGGGELSICSPLDCGTACGEFFPLRPESEMPGDQRIDDADSLVFETRPLPEAIEILGPPVLRAQLSIDREIGNLAVRLVDVHPDGAGTRVSFGVINLACWCACSDEMRPALDGGRAQ